MRARTFDVVLLAFFIGIAATIGAIVTAIAWIEPEPPVVMWVIGG
jgi:hypothetical protein